MAYKSPRITICHSPSQTSPSGIASQLQQLSQLHESVSARIRDRTSLAEERLSAWESYRSAQADAFAWLADVERKKLRLDLRHLDSGRTDAVLGQIRVRKWGFYVTHVFILLLLEVTSRHKHAHPISKKRSRCRM